MIQRPRLELAKPAAAGVPLLLTENLPDRLWRLVTHPLAFKELHGSQLLPRHEARRMTPRRIERREAMYLLGCALGKRYDLVSARIGSPRSDSFLTTDGELGYGPNKSQRYVNAPGQEGEDGLCADTGLTVTRLRRAIGEYRALGWLTSSQRVVEYRKNGELRYYACRVVYVLTPKFWADLGLSEKVTKARRAACKRAGHRERIYAVRPHANQGGRRKREREIKGHWRDAEARARAATEAAEQDANERRALLRRQMEIRALHPEWSAEQVRAAAARHHL